ncbi:hypothetical protein [Modestobacter lapidis]|nr:hypothetical protein [Modestobacter lapidis]
MSVTRTGEPGMAGLLARAAAAEWTRMWTVRTTWWCLLAAAVTVVGLGLTFGIDVGGDPGGAPPAQLAGEIAVLPGQFALLVLVLLAVTPEYATGAIGTTLQWTPRRGVLLAARVGMPVAVATAAGVLLALAADLAAWAAQPRMELSFPALAGSLGSIAIVLLAGGLLAVGAGLLLRSTAGALAAVFLVQLVLPFLLPAFGVGWMSALSLLLPGSAATFLLLGEPDMTTASAAAVLAVWSGGALAAGAWSLLRRDAA